MERFMNYEDFLNENEVLLTEGTIAGYKYRFKFEDKKYLIHQGKKDKSIFGVKDKDGDWIVLTKGHLFTPKHYDMTRNEMVEFLQKGIKYFNVRNPVTVDDVKSSEWSKFFSFELEKKPGRITKRYCILKLHCGKAAAKWLTRHEI